MGDGGELWGHKTYRFHFYSFTADSELIKISDVVNWEFKWEDTDEAKIYGPYSSEQMQEWVEQDYFKDGVYVRKTGSNQAFNNSRRIDFELYT